MRVVVVTPPAPVVSLADAKTHLRVDGDSENDLITGMVAAATAHLDGPDGWLGRALGVQTLEARGDLFRGGGAVELPCPPVVSVTLVKFLDSAGVEQTLASSAYEVRGDTILPAWATRWPTSRLNGDGVRVRYQAGYATLPAPIRAAVLLMVGVSYTDRDRVPEAAGAVAALLAPYRVWA